MAKDVMAVRRTSNGLRVASVAFSAGPVQALASPHHQLVVHASAPIRVSCRADGHRYQGLQSRGDMDFLPAGHTGEWLDEGPSRAVVLTLSPQLLLDAAGELGLDATQRMPAARFRLRDPALEHLAWALESELEAPASTEWLYGESLAHAIALRLVQSERLDAASLTPGRMSRPQLRRVTEFIEAHLEGPLHLKDVAAVANMGVSQLKVRFKLSVGLPVHQYVMHRRVERARLLLTSGGHTVPQVALSCGFSDASHLAKWMRRLLGVTPRALVSSAN